MNKFLFILLQSGPPDPGDWGNPDAVPVNQDLPILIIAGLAIGVYTLVRPRVKKVK